MPLVLCRSRGGPYDDEAFVSGWRLGDLAAKLAQPGISTIADSIRPHERLQADLIAMACWLPDDHRVRRRGVAVGHVHANPGGRLTPRREGRSRFAFRPPSTLRAGLPAQARRWSACRAGPRPPSSSSPSPSSSRRRSRGSASTTAAERRPGEGRWRDANVRPARGHVPEPAQQWVTENIPGARLVTVPAESGGSHFAFWRTRHSSATSWPTSSGVLPAEPR